MGDGVGDVEVEHCGCDDGVEGGGAGEVEEAVDAAEEEGEDGGADRGGVVLGAEVSEVGGEGDAVLEEGM